MPVTEHFTPHRAPLHRVRDRRQRPVRRHIGVAADDHPDAGIQLVPPGLQTVHEIAQRLGVLIAEVEEIRRLVHRDHSEAGHPLHASLGRHPGMLDPGSRVSQGRRRQPTFESREYVADRLVTLRMHADSPAQTGRPLDQLDQLVRPMEVRRVLPLGSSRRAERCRSTGEAAVGVHLQVPDRQVLITERPGQAKRLELIELVRQWHAHGAHAQHTSATRLAVAAQLARGDLGVGDAREAGSPKGSTGSINSIDQHVQAGALVEVGTVRADVDLAGDDGAAGGIKAQARQPARLIPDEPATWRIGCVLVDPRPGQHHGVHQHVVPRRVEELEWVVTGSGIELSQ